MKHPDNIRSAQERFAELVQNFDPKAHAKEHPLEPFVENIRILREQGATYKTVNIMLKEVGVEVCVTTVARFCQIRLLHPIRRKAKRKRAKKTAKNASENTKKTLKKVSDTPSEITEEVSPQETGKKRRGPRIADPKNI